MRTTHEVVPGIGMLRLLRTKAGRQIGVLHHRGGHRQLVVYDSVDRDATVLEVDLDPAEATELSQFLEGDFDVTDWQDPDGSWSALLLISRQAPDDPSG